VVWLEDEIDEWDLSLSAKGLIADFVRSWTKNNQEDMPLLSFSPMALLSFSPLAVPLQVSVLRINKGSRILAKNFYWWIQRYSETQSYARYRPINTSSHIMLINKVYQM
jgi:hypothetical protein